MSTEKMETQVVNAEIVRALRKRAAKARRNANTALLAVFILIFTGISLFYFAGDIVVRESEPVRLYLRESPPNENRPQLPERPSLKK